MSLLTRCPHPPPMVKATVCPAWKIGSSPHSQKSAASTVSQPKPVAEALTVFSGVITL